MGRRTRTSLKTAVGVILSFDPPEVSSREKK